MTAPRGGRHGRTINSKANFVILPVNQLPYGVCGENWGKSTGIRSSRRNATFHRHKLYSISSSVTTTPSALICLDLSPLLVHFIPFFIRIIIIIYFYTFFLILELLKKKIEISRYGNGWKWGVTLDGIFDLPTGACGPNYLIWIVWGPQTTAIQSCTFQKDDYTCLRKISRLQVRFSHKSIRHDRGKATVFQGWPSLGHPVTIDRIRGYAAEAWCRAGGRAGGRDKHRE